MNKTIVVLGAMDPEMQAIKGLCETAGLTVIQATAGGKPVHPGNSYKAELPLPDAGAEYVLVECSPPEGHPLAHATGTYPVYMDQQAGQCYSYCPEGGEYAGDYQVTRIDHHRLGDPGYGKPPVEFLSASSLGQIVALLGQRDCLRGSPITVKMDEGGLDTRPFKRLKLSEPEVPGWHYYLDADDHSDSHWSAWAYVWPDQSSVLAAATVVMTAAADHCLEAAYRGLCPGVDPDVLMQWRAESRAAFQGRSVEAVLADVEAARRLLKDAPVLDCRPDLTTAGRYGTGWDDSMPDGSFIPPEHLYCRDLRGQNVPELPEAAAREGLAFVASTKDRDGREKVVLQAALPELVRRFLAREIILGLVEMYGDPARGFAGGYLP